MSAPRLQRLLIDNTIKSEPTPSPPIRFLIWSSPAAQQSKNMDMEFLYEGLSPWEWELQVPEEQCGDALAQPPCSRVGGGSPPPTGDHFWDGCHGHDNNDALLFAALESPLGSEYTTEDEELFDDFLNRKISSEVVDLVDQFINSPEFGDVEQFIIGSEFEDVLRNLEESQEVAMDDSDGEHGQHQVVPNQPQQQQIDAPDNEGVKEENSESTSDESTVSEMTPLCGGSTAPTMATAATTTVNAATTVTNPQVPIIVHATLASIDLSVVQPTPTITIVVDENGTVLGMNQLEDNHLSTVAAIPPAPAPALSTTPPPLAPTPDECKPVLVELAVASTSDWRPEVKSEPESVSSPTSSPKAKRCRTSRKATPYQRPSSSNKSSSWEDDSDDGGSGGGSSISSSSSGSRLGGTAGGRPAPPKERKRSQNRTAANRYREKKRQASEALEGEMEGLAVNNKELKGRVEQLTNEIGYLKGLMKDILLAKGLIKK